MSGPIVRSGPSPEFSKNWESVFGKPGTSAAAAAKKATNKGAGKKSAKKAPGKKAKKSGK